MRFCLTMAASIRSVSHSASISVTQIMAVAPQGAVTTLRPLRETPGRLLVMEMPCPLHLTPQLSQTSQLLQHLS